MIAEVIVDILNSNVDRVFDYKLSKSAQTSIGSRVIVPFANKQVEGYVINLKEKSELSDDKLKEIIKNKDAQPLLNQKQIRLCFFMKEKFYLRLIDGIRLLLPPQIRLGKIKQKIVSTVELKNDNLSLLKKNATAQINAVLFMREVGCCNLSVLNQKFGNQAVKKLVELGILQLSQFAQNRAPQSKFTVKNKKIILTQLQQNAVDKINHGNFQPYLLHGVTGSGKTEVYINCIKKVLNDGKTAIMLVPEISLTPQMFSRFKNAFGNTVAIIHSSLSDGERFDEWNRIKNGEAKIVIGARSAIFAPLDNVGIIIIDEEHDSSYFSESNPRFYTHDVAEYLAYLNNCPLVLGSATPSIATYYKAKTGKYALLELPNRANQKDLPTVQVVDMLGEISQGNTGVFSNAFLHELENCIANKKQAMVFINRRGFSSFLMCRECGYVPKCDACDVSLVYHKDENVLKCHYCNKRFRAPSVCPKCKSKSIRYGAVGTQRVVEELSAILPSVPILRLDNDATKSKDAYVEILEQFNNTTPAILVGTQMIAKGHDFNNVTLVGIIDADLSLHFSDFRATEKTFQLITQVSGRAGRSEHQGKVVLQTYSPKHYVYRCASNYDYTAFYKKEINLREVSKFPPFTEILRVLISSEDENKALDSTRALNDLLKPLKEKYSSDFVYFSAMKCPHKKLQNKYRFQILMRFYTKNKPEIIRQIFDCCDKINKTKINVFVELNPQNLS